MGVVAHVQDAEELQPLEPLPRISLHERQRLDSAVMCENMLIQLQALPTGCIKAKHAVSFFRVTDSKGGTQQVKVTCLACGYAFASIRFDRLEQADQAHSAVRPDAERSQGAVQGAQPEDHSRLAVVVSHEYE